MKGRRYAENTKVPVAQTIAEVPVLLARYGGDRFQHITDSQNGYFVFSYGGYTISFSFPLQSNQTDLMRIYRAARLAIQGKLESVASGIESPAQAFTAHIIDDDGLLLFNKIRPLLPKPADN